MLIPTAPLQRSLAKLAWLPSRLTGSTSATFLAGEHETAAKSQLCAQQITILFPLFATDG